MIVEVREEERTQMEEMYSRGIKNGMRLKKMKTEEIREKEHKVRGMEEL